MTTIRSFIVAAIALLAWNYAAAAQPTATVPTTAASQAVASDLPAPAGPDDFVRLALQRSPNLAAARHRAAAAEARIKQRAALEDPMLMVRPIGEMDEEVMLGLSQALPLPGKLRLQGQIAAEEAAMARQDGREAELDLAAQVRKSYWAYYVAGQAIDVTEATRDLMSSFRDIADSRFRAGSAIQQDLLRASVELSRIDNELITLRQEQTNAAAMLNSLMDRPVDARLPELEPARLVDEPAGAMEVMLERAHLDSPQIESLRRSEEAARLMAQRTRLDRWPDLTVGGGYSVMDDDEMDEDQDDEWWLEVSVNVPIWQTRRRAAEREALEARHEALARTRAAENELSATISQAATLVETQRRQALLLRDVILPQAQQTVDAAAASYRAGGTDFEDLVDNWRQLLESQLMYQRALADLHTAQAELDQAMGADPLAGHHAEQER